MSLGPVLSWKRASLVPALLRLWWAALIALAVGLFASLGMKALPAIAFGAGIWLILGSFVAVFERVRLFRVPLSDSLARLASLPRSVLGAAIAHAGLGVTIAGIAGMSLAVHTIVALHPGESTQLGGYTWTLENLHDAPGPNYMARVATIQVSRDGHAIATLAPSRRSYPVQQQTVTDTAIRTNLLFDMYTALGEERDGAAVVRLHINPLAPWIWLGALVMAFGGGLSLIDRRLRVGAPSRRALAVPA
jgi:cytochrome c-type biogenesis protein CcmF